MVTHSLLPHHLHQLTDESGLTAATIEARGYRSVTKKAELSDLGFTRIQQHVPALLCPVWNVAGDIGNYQLRPDAPRIHRRRGKPIKYETPSDSHMLIDVPPAARPFLGDPQRPLWATEGIKKGDALAQLGLCVIDLLGVWNWRGRNAQGGTVVLPDFEAIALKDRQVYVVFDSDVMLKEEVYQALYRFGRWLDSRKAHVAYVYLPPTDGGQKQGVDDFLAGGGTLEDLLQRASSTLREPTGGWSIEGLALKPSQLAELIATKWRDAVIFDRHRRQWLRYGVRQAGIWGVVDDEDVLEDVRQELTELLPEGFHVQQWQGVARLLRTMLHDALPMPTRDWLPCRNGALHLPTMQLHAHTAERGFTWCLPFDYDRSATCDQIDDWLLEAQGGDAARVQVLKAYLKAIVTGRTDLQRFLELVEPGGTGKGTYQRLAMGLVGLDNVHVTDLRQLETNRFETSNLIDKRLVVITDADRYGGPVNVLKALTGGDPLRAERKYDRESRHFMPESMVIVGANEPIQSTDYTSGLERRRISIPFRHQPGEPRVLMAFHRGEPYGEFVAELAGLLNSVLAITDDAMERVLRRTHEAVPSLQEAWMRTLTETNGLAAWADMYLVFDPREDVKTYIGDADREAPHGPYLNTHRWLYASYRAYADAAGERSYITLRRFRGLFEDLCQHQLQLDAVQWGRDQGGRYFTAVRLLSTPDAHKSGFIEQAAKRRTPRADTNGQSPAPESAESAGSMLDQTLGSADSAGYAGSSKKVTTKEEGHTHNGQREKKCVCVDAIGGIFRHHPAYPAYPALTRVCCQHRPPLSSRFSIDGPERDGPRAEAAREAARGMALSWAQWEASDMIGVEVKDGLYIITVPKCVVVLTKQQFIQALRRGKWWKRRQALQARLPGVKRP